MKPALTTSGNEFMKRVASKLAIPHSDNCTLFFSVFPSLGTDHFSIQLIEEERPFLIARQWKWNQNTSYPLGVHIYDLNNIRIDERKIPVSSEDYTSISGIREMEIIVEELDGIMLDGNNVKLVIGQEEYCWHTDHQISTELQGLLNKLIDLAGISR
jgi:hypothetical protein